MPGNNEDYLRRLKNDGRHDLLKQIEAKELTVYGAAIAAGYRKSKSAASREEQLTYHWKRADEKEKIRFIVRNIVSLIPMVRRVLKKHELMKADKPSE